jgi:multidrug efflux system membrane fusion protein
MKSGHIGIIGTLFMLALPAMAQQSVAGQSAAAQPQPALFGEMSSYEGVVEAERQTVIAAQVSGNIVELAIKAGDHVKKGQLLLRIDAHVAAQSAAASKAQIASVQASLELARKELDRQKQLFTQGYISQAAEDRAEAKFKVAEGEVGAQIAQAAAAVAETGFYTVRAPYAGIIAEVPVALGSMAMPGLALLTLYDPSALRVTTNLPQSIAIHGLSASMLKMDISGQELTPVHVKILPTVDVRTDTAEIRLALPPQLQTITPGMFARVRLSTSGQTTDVVKIPLAAVVRRAELTGAYVLDGKNQPLLRQIRLGRTLGDQVEVLSGLSPDDRVAQNAQTALGTVAH